MAGAEDPGPGVDAQGQPVVDPTKNVLDLVEAAIRRQDDLRNVEAVNIRRDLDEKIRTLKEYFVAILDEQRRGMGVAEEEREKSARALREELSRQIDDGDRNLREHIQAQVEHLASQALNNVEQLKLALAAAQRLEEERHRGIDKRFEDVAETGETRANAIRREMQLVNEASEQAIAKADAATEKRFASVNEWRAQSSDRERSQQEQTAILTATFAPRELMDAQLADIRRSIQALSDKVNRVV